MPDFDVIAALGPAGETALAVAGTAAVILLISGPIMLRAQRQRQQFQLAKLAIEKGSVQLPLESPAWLQSMRSAVMTLTLGIALLIAGGVSYELGSGVSQPAATTQAQAIPQLDLPGFRPPPPSAAEEAWHEARAERRIGLTALGCGVILSMLGIARFGFARVEKRYEMQRSSNV